MALQARANPEEDPSILDGALNPKLRKGQTAPTTDELTADALLQILAGTDTTAHTLTIAVYHVLANPSIHQSITRELCTAMPTKQSTLDGPALETLPYLHALIKESLRFAYGAPGRLPRIVPSTGATFCGHPLPPGTVVSASHYVSHHNPAVFGPDEFVFRPERWLGDDVSDLERNMVSFSRGSRACAGMNLAYAELRIVLAHLFRRFELSLWRTTSADMEWKDCYVPNTKGPLKVMIKEASD